MANSHTEVLCRENKMEEMDKMDKLVKVRLLAST
jgi:hypothetical protein